MFAFGSIAVGAFVVASCASDDSPATPASIPEVEDDFEASLQQCLAEAGIELDPNDPEQVEQVWAAHPENFERCAGLGEND